MSDVAHDSAGRTLRGGQSKAARLGRVTVAPETSSRGKAKVALLENGHETCALPWDDRIEKIRAEHNFARYNLKQRMSLERRLQSFVVRNFVTLPKAATDAERKAAWKQAGAMIKTTAKAVKRGAGDVGSALVKPVLTFVTAVAAFEAAEAVHRKEMESLAAQLPVAAWCASVRGIGLLTLAQIVGEAGDLADYPSHSKFWKRMGVAVIDGKRQGRPGAHATAEDWTAHGYVPERRSLVFVTGENLIRGNGKDGRYYRRYSERKALEAAKAAAEGVKRSKLYLHLRAKRYMEKRFLRDLWREWRKAGRASHAAKAVEWMPALPIPVPA